MNRHRCEELPCPKCGMDLKAWADANRVEGIEHRNRVMTEALVRIASLGEGPVVDGSFDEPNAARVAREVLALDWIGPCEHGRDPWDRCDQPGCANQTEAWARAYLARCDAHPARCESVGPDGFRCDLAAGHDGAHRSGAW